MSISLFSICLFVAIQDVAIDGIVCDVLNEEDYEQGANMQNVGQIFGLFGGSNAFLLISNDTWCQKYLGLNQKLIGYF